MVLVSFLLVDVEKSILEIVECLFLDKIRMKDGTSGH